MNVKDQSRSGPEAEERCAEIPQTPRDEFHIFASLRDLMFELELPGNQTRVQFGSLYNAARYARRCSNGRAATIVVHDLAVPRVNRIPFYGKHASD